MLRRRMACSRGGRNKREESLDWHGKVISPKSNVVLQEKDLIVWPWDVWILRLFLTSRETESHEDSLWTPIWGQQELPHELVGNYEHCALGTPSVRLLRYPSFLNFKLNICVGAWFFTTSSLLSQCATCFRYHRHEASGWALPRFHIQNPCPNHILPAAGLNYVLLSTVVFCLNPN